ncbi:MAG: indolepyruvate oxidoreductase subunit beta [Phycisphaerae bacterium]|nr:indolepyruvate oxidoreductase subunit beta [Phycisphaerae bacterium]
MSAGSVTNVLLAGVGGQGILRAAEIIARAALVVGYQVKTNEIHGMAQRGGSVVAQIRYGPEVHSPVIAEGTAQVLGALEQIEAIRYAHYVAPGGLAVVSGQSIIPVTVSTGGAKYPQDVKDRLGRLFSRLVYFDAPKMALEAGNIQAANTVILGAMSSGLDLPPSAWMEAINTCLPEKHRKVNVRAFEAGRAWV